MEYHAAVIKDFAIRTRHNLQLVEGKAPSGNRYPVTQLINSLLGLIVFPNEKVLAEVDEEKIPSSWWDNVETQYELPNRRPLNKKQKIKLLRNSIAHCNVRVIDVDEQREIKTLQFWNIDPRKSNKITWIVKVDVDALRKLADEILDFVEHSELFEKKQPDFDPLKEARAQDSKQQKEQVAY